MQQTIEANKNKKPWPGTWRVDRTRPLLSNVPSRRCTHRTTVFLLPSRLGEKKANKQKKLSKNQEREPSKPTQKRPIRRCSFSLDQKSVQSAACGLCLRSSSCSAHQANTKLRHWLKFRHHCTQKRRICKKRRNKKEVPKTSNLLADGLRLNLPPLWIMAG